ncbi:MAG: hypothetical protein QXS54_07905 [Candidatus Methanomethylicaceae archaeon]
MGPVHEKASVREEAGSWADGACDARNGLRTGQNVHLRACSCQAPGAGNRLQWCACDRGSCTEEPDEGKLSRPVRERRWGGRPPHRPQRADSAFGAAAQARLVGPLVAMVEDMERHPNIPKKSSQFELRYDVRVSSQGYSNIASVLAGFALAAVVLVVQSSPPAIGNAALLRDWASIAFLVAFFGCVMAAFVFSVVAGEEVLAPRSHTMALIGGAGLAMSTVYIFWGLVILADLFLSPGIVTLARLIFISVTLIAPLYLMLAALRAYPKNPEVV